MQLPETTIEKLELDEDLREAVDRARAVSSPVARRRAERTLAGTLRGVDLADLHDRVTKVQETGSLEPQLFHLAERWRTRLIDEDAAAAEFPGGAAAPLLELIERARRERDTGKPPGASRALFRHVLAVLKAQPR